MNISNFGWSSVGVWDGWGYVWTCMVSGGGGGKLRFVTLPEKGVRQKELGKKRWNNDRRVR